MKFISFTGEELTGEKGLQNVLTQNQHFFTEYFRTFVAKERFITDTNIALNRINPDDLQIKINLIIKSFEILVPKIQEFLHEDVNLPVYLVVGPGVWDGHGILIDGRPAVFFDMTAMLDLMNNPAFNLEFHLTHKTLHAIHYSYTPEFYPGNYKNIRDKYLRRMIAEGVVTYLSSQILVGAPGDYLWFGLLDQMRTRFWISRSEMDKQIVWGTLRRLVADNQDDAELGMKLFSVGDYDPEVMMEGRLGYYYGTEIARSVAEDVGLHRLLTMKLVMFKEYAENFFEEKLN